MARLHILEGDARGAYRCILHEPVPATNNPAGIPYRTALINSGKGGRTEMATGNGPGQITAAELTQIQAGELWERQFEFAVDPAWSAAERNAAMDAQIASLSQEMQAEITIGLRAFGLTRG